MNEYHFIFVKKKVYRKAAHNLSTSGYLYEFYGAQAKNLSQIHI